MLGAGGRKKGREGEKTGENQQLWGETQVDAASSFLNLK